MKMSSTEACTVHCNQQKPLILAFISSIFQIYSSWRLSHRVDICHRAPLYTVAMHSHQIQSKRAEYILNNPMHTGLFCLLWP